MYYQSAFFPSLSDGRALNTCIAIADAWITGIERHRTAQAEAVRDFCNNQINVARHLLDAEDGAEFTARVLATVAAEPLRLLAMASTFAEIAADTHRSTLELIEGYSVDVATNAGERPGERSRERPLRSRKGERKPFNPAA